MNLSRRTVLTGAAALPVAPRAVAAPEAAPSLPDRVNFRQSDVANLDCGTTHPIPRAGRTALDAYIARRAGDRTAPPALRDGESVQAKFARLINASPDEIAFVQSTTTGEQMVVRALGLPLKGAHIVTDTLHFFGSFPMYVELQRQGCEVTWVRHSPDGSIAIEDMAQAIRPGTKLVALSQVSTVNGFQHDVKAVCDLAHAVGAMVYADIVHAAGCVPVDVRASGVDFAACASYKWLMGDFGLGFLYVRKDRQAGLGRMFYGYHGIATFGTHIYPFDTPGADIADYSYADSANGVFALGTYAHPVEALLSASLDYIQSIGVARIQTHAQPLAARVRRELGARGFRSLTSIDTPTPFAAFAYENSRAVLGPKLAAAGVRVTLAANRFRITTSVFNSDADIDRLLAALA